MSAHRWVVPFVAAYSVCGSCAASDFELTIRTHSERIKFGDPLYIEVTLVNRGKEPVIAPPVSMAAATFGFKAYDPNTQLTMQLGESGGAFGFQPVKYEPNKPTKHYWHVFLPGLPRFDHPFWKPIRSKGQRVRIWGSYGPRQRLSVSSEAIDVLVESRDEDEEEMRTLEHWAMADFKGAGKGPMPHDLGLSFRSGFSRAQTAELASKIQEGEIHDLLLLSLQMMDIYATPDDSRDAKNRGLVEWLKKQPDIKRQVLIQEVTTIAGAYNLTSTRETLKQLHDPP